MHDEEEEENLIRNEKGELLSWVCSACEGFGQRDAGYGRTIDCSVCDGHGLVSEPEGFYEGDEAKCEACSGAGMFENVWRGGFSPCGECGGEGMIHEGVLSEGAHPSDDQSLFVESTNFDRFMDKIIISESKVKKFDMIEDNPQRRRQAARQERPLGRIVYGVKR
jgi:hypothetical protein